MEALRPKFVKEMKKTGLKKPEIGTFVVVGVVLWAILLWMFVNRYNKIEDTPSSDRNGSIRNMNIIIIIFHIGKLVIVVYVATLNRFIVLIFFVNMLSAIYPNHATI